LEFGISEPGDTSPELGGWGTISLLPSDLTTVDPGRSILPGERSMRCIWSFCVLGLLLGPLAEAALPVYSEGHADIGVRLVNGKLEIGFNLLGATVDGALLTDFVPVSSLAVLVPESTREARPENITGLLNFNPIGVPAGFDIFRLSSSGTEAFITGSPYLGFGTYLLPAADFTGAVTFQLTSFWSQKGGEFSLYQDSFPGPTFRVATADGISAADTFQLSLGAHDHYNWVFTSDGLYSMGWTATAQHKTLGTLSASGVMSIGVTTVIPEASTLLLAGLGIGGWLVVGCSRRSQAFH
jgi:surface-anchored protein